MLAGRHDCLFLWIPDDSHSVAWLCLPGFLRHPIPERLVVVLIVLGRFSPPSSFRAFYTNFPDF